MTQPIVLCADDYGHTAAISRAIFDLADNGRISALSCMTAATHWREHGARLKDLHVRADIGLHVTLVDETPLTRMPRTAPDGRLPNIKTLIIKSYLGLLDLREIADEIQAQIEAFESVTGFAPDHIDGHLHTHVLPGIRDLILDAAQRISPRPWLRNIHDAMSAIMQRGVAAPKAAFLSALGHGLAKSDAAMNDSFSGIYAFAPENKDYGALFARFVTGTGKRPLIMCHPGESGDDAAHADLRAGEYAFFKSAAFTDCLARHNLRLGRFAETLT